MNKKQDILKKLIKMTKTQTNAKTLTKMKMEKVKLKWIQNINKTTVIVSQ